MENKSKVDIDELIKIYNEKKCCYNYMNLKNPNTGKPITSAEDLYDTFFYKNVIQNKIIYFGNPKNFNDENEFDIEPNKETLDPIFKKLYKNDQNQIILAYSRLKEIYTRAVENHKNNMAIFCVTPTFLDDYFWTEYCNDYFGVCCEYDMSIYNGIIPCKKVIYSDNSPKHELKYIDNNHVGNLPLPSYISNEIGKASHDEIVDFYMNVLSTKKYKWCNELENRYLYHEKSFNGNRTQRARLLKIYIGYNVCQTVKDEIIKICDDNKIEYEIVNKSEYNSEKCKKTIENKLRKLGE